MKLMNFHVVCMNCLEKEEIMYGYVNEKGCLSSFFSSKNVKHEMEK